METDLEGDLSNAAMDTIDDTSFSLILKKIPSKLASFGEKTTFHCKQ